MELTGLVWCLSCLALPPQERRLSAPLVTGGNVTASAAAPDRVHVVYVADQDTDGVFELYGARLDGSLPPVRLSAPLVSGGDVAPGDPSVQPPPVLVSGDSQRAVYLADAFTNDVVELFSVPVDASQSAVRLNGSLVAGGDVKNYAVSSDGSRVVFVADQTTDETWDLYSVPTAGGTAIRLNAGLGALRDARSFALAPDGERVVFALATTVYSVPTAGGAAVLLASTQFPLFEFTPDGERLALQGTTFSGDLYSEWYFAGSIDGPPTLRNVYLYSGFVQTQGPSDFASNAALVAIGDPDGLRVAPMDGSQNTHSLVANAALSRVAFAPDGQRILYVGHTSAAPKNQLYSVAATGGTPLRLNHTLTGLDEVNDFVVGAVGERVAYRVGTRAYSVPVDGSAPALLLSGTVSVSALPAPFLLAPEARRLLFRGSSGGTDGLYAVPLDGCAAPTRLHGPPLTLLQSVSVPAQGNEVLFRANLAGGSVLELYASAYRPALDSLAPARGPLLGGNTVLVHGSGFTPSSAVSFGAVPAATTWIDSATLSVVVPARPGPLGTGGRRAQVAPLTVDVRVEDCGESARLVGGYRYAP